MSRPARAGLQPAFLITLLGLAALAGISLVDRGATQMYALPWSLLRWVAVLAPWVALVFRSVALHDSLRLPATRWRWALGLGAAVLVASALASPWPRQSLLWLQEPLSGFGWALVIFDWVELDAERHGPTAQRVGGWIAAVFAAVSLLHWASDLSRIPFGSDFIRTAAETRNPHPLGHSNYTAGLCLLLAPWPWALFGRARTDAAKVGWLAVFLAIGLVLVTSGSRGGLLGLGAEVLVWLCFQRLSAHKLLFGLGAAVIAVGLLAVANPRIRNLSRASDPQAAPDESRVQRAGMAAVGWQLGAARPILGWGPGTTPLAYPRFRTRAEAGVEDALELHSSPIQLWAETGLAGLVAAAALVVLAAVSIRRAPVAAIALAGYGLFALTDWQFDVPLFDFLCAGTLALLMGPAPTRTPSAFRGAGAMLAVALLALLGLGGAEDRSPLLNARALALGQDPKNAARAVSLLNESLKLNPDQEIALFNRGWLTVTSNPAQAGHDFAAAAALVPDKGGVYFGEALAALNQGAPPRSVVDLLSQECINDPAFMTSPWWRSAPFDGLRSAVFARIDFRCDGLTREVTPGRWPEAELAYFRELARWIGGRATSAEVRTVANTPARRAFFAQPRSFETLPGARVSRRERTGYPVLMRQPAIGEPIDVYLVQDDSHWTIDRAFLFPAKGWIQGPLRIELSRSAALLKP